MTQDRTHEHRNRLDGTIDRSQTDWYKDAVIYQLHVKAYQDSNDDGVGDFAGLMRRLDHVQELGATAIWLLPFYPSPLRDDGYDIADYKAINPAYGKMADFKGFIAEAHRRGLRVITELVINHTSDQHPWFQKARNAKPGSAARDMYVWSDTDTKFPETRIIFTDTEKSNWTWDPVAGAYYWHRFYSHQPDLNFDNPRVLEEVLKVMHFWLEMGVDGLRLDAIPYLVEREGTNNENLPETHVVLKKIRAELDAHYSDRMLLAEANQWPEDTRPYFGDGDECHMGFHFPLMPRMYMAVAREDRHPITDIIRQTPDIPENCQWAVFLRNHDELTLEMVTDEERDYLWRTYAEDSRARINLGIRRRLAPLMQNDRRKVELMNSLLLSMPGTPIIYYGDEIGMGDNYYLGDRDGVRTPMQWSLDRNAGFSRANPQQLYLPLIMDPIYGYQAINVESQQRDTSSLLNWMRRMIAVRKEHPAFGRGSMILLYPRNRRVLAYIRELDGNRILCVANLSRAAQAVELDLSRWKGAVPIELMGRSAFPPVGELPYLVTLPGHGFFWFLLAEEAETPAWHLQMPDVLPEFVTLTTKHGVAGALDGRERVQLANDVLPKFLPLQPWFAGLNREIGPVTIDVIGEMGAHMLTMVDCDVDGEMQKYFLPLSARWGEENLAFGAPKLSYTMAKLRSGPQIGALIDGAFDEELAGALLGAIREGRVVEAGNGRIVCAGNDGLAAIADAGEPRALDVEQRNVSIAFDASVVLKIYRRLRAGAKPEVEVARYLTEEAGFANTPTFLGSMEFQPADGGDATVLAAAFAYVLNQGDAWDVVTNALHHDIEEHAMFGEGSAPRPAEHELSFPHALMVGEVLGRRTAELHRALARPTDDTAFAVEPVTGADVEAWILEAEADLGAMFERIDAAWATLPEDAREAAGAVRESRDALLGRIRAVRGIAPSGGRSRIHGDYHLGQVLMVHDDVMIIDFEGEAQRSMDLRRGKTSPLRDLAGMLRSFHYAASDAVAHAPHAGPWASEGAASRAFEWAAVTSADFLRTYLANIEGCETYPRDAAFAGAVLDMFMVQKAAYEVGYELANRPGWVKFPLQGLLDILGREERSLG